jgi:beta-galactosidase
VANNLIDFALSGPGKIIGVGNGDPSCHEPDVYVTAPPGHQVALKDWRMIRVPSARDRAEVAEKFDDSQWQTVDVNSQEGPLAPDESAVYRATFTATPDMLAAPSVALSFGMIDDDGWVYVNGQRAGESHDWTASPSFEVRKFLHEGANSIAVAVKNHDGPGGVNKGVSLDIEDQPIEPQWKRSVFNGLAQVIIQAGTEPGALALTARAEGLSSATAGISAGPAVPRPALP